MLRRPIQSTAAAARRLAGTLSPAAAAVEKEESSRERDTLGERLLALTYTKRSAVVEMRKWKEEGKVIRKYELNRIVRELRRLKRFKHALEVCEWMRTQEDIKLLPGDYAVHLDLIAKLRGLNSAEKFFEDLPEEMRKQPTCTSLLHTYVQSNAYAKAEALMDRMSECGFLRSPLPYNHMMSLYISLGQLKKVPELLGDLKKNTSPDLVTYNLLLSVYASRNHVEAAEKVLLKMKKAKIEPDWLTYSTLTSLYIKEGLNEKAISSLKEMEKRVTQKTRVAYSSLLSLHTYVGDKDGVRRIWKKLKYLYPKLNDAEYNCMVSSLIKLGELEEAEKLYAEWESVSPTGDTRIPNLLLAAYINEEQWKMAEIFYEGIVKKGIKPSYTTFELLSQCYLKQRRNKRALSCFERAIACVKKWEPNDRIIKEMFKNLEEDRDVEGGEKLLVILRKKAGYVTTEIYNALLRIYARAGKMPLVVAERMREDNLELDEETNELITLTSKMCIADFSSCISHCT